MYDEAFWFPIALPLFGLRKLRWSPGNLYVFDDDPIISKHMDALPPLSRHEVASGIDSSE